MGREESMGCGGRNEQSVTGARAVKERSRALGFDAHLRELWSVASQKDGGCGVTIRTHDRQSRRDHASLHAVGGEKPRATRGELGRGQARASQNKSPKKSDLGDEISNGQATGRSGVPRALGLAPAAHEKVQRIQTLEWMKWSREGEENETRDVKGQSRGGDGRRVQE